MYQSFEARPYAPDNAHVLAFYDGPLLLWWPQAGFAPDKAPWAHERVSLAVALASEDHRTPLLLANLCDQDIAALTAPSPLAAVCGAPECPGGTLSACELISRARRWHLVDDYWAQALEFKEVAAVQEDWLPGPDVEVQLPQALWPQVLR